MDGIGSFALLSAAVFLGAFVSGLAGFTGLLLRGARGMSSNADNELPARGGSVK